MRTMPDLYDIFIHQLAQIDLSIDWHATRFFSTNSKTIIRQFNNTFCDFFPHTEFQIITDKKMVIYLFNFILLVQMRLYTAI